MSNSNGGLIVKMPDGEGFELNGSTPLSDVLSHISSKQGSSIDGALLQLWDHLNNNGKSNSKFGQLLESAVTQFSTNSTFLKGLLEGPVGNFLLDTQGEKKMPVPRKLRDAQSSLIYELESSKKFAIKNGDVTFAAKGGMGFSATLDVLKASQAGLRPPLAFPASDAILKASIAGTVDVEGSFKVPFNGGSANGKAGTGAAMALNAYYQWPSETTIVGALVDSISDLVTPWDLESVGRQLSQPSTTGEWRGLRRFSLDASGRLDLSASIAAGYTWAYAGTNSYNGANISADAKVGAGLSVGWSRSGQFRIAVERLYPDQSIRVSVARLDKGGRTFGFDLTAEMSVKGLGDIAQPIVDRLLPDQGGLLEKLQKWSAPGTTLIEKLDKSIGTKDPTIKLLAELLLGRASSGDAVAHVKMLLLNEIKEQINTATPFWGDLEDPNAMARNLGRMLAERFGTEGEDTKAVVNSLAVWLAKPLKAIKSELEEDLAEIVDGNAGSLEGLFAVFASIGENVNALVTKANEAATNLLSPAIKLLTFYEEARTKVIKALNAAFDIKLGLALKATYAKSETSDVELAFTIRKMTPRTKLLYRSLLTGRLDSLWDILEQARECEEISEIEGIFSSTVKRERSLNLSLNLGSHGIAWTRSNLSEARVDVDASGTITIASGNFSSATSVKAFGESSGARMIGSIDFAAALSNPRSALPLTLGFDFNYEDKRMKPKELSNYLSSFNSSGFSRQLFSSEAIEHALDVYGDQPLQATISSAVSLDILALQSLIASSATTQGAERILNSARSALVAVGAANLSIATLRALANSTDARDVAREIGEIAGLNEDQLSLRFKEKTGVPLPSTTQDSPASRLYRNVRAINQLASGLLDSLRAMGSAGDAFSAAKAKAATLDSVPVRQRIYFKALDSINERVNSGLAGWFRQFYWVDEAPSFAVALLATLAQLTNEDDVLLVAIARISAPDGTARIIAF
ncbi:hypothetical protein [Dokdonella sp.]|uniref:hypothetical protein n=1 Tax=Dokdonella sp. TaxID=2291710 RepID=UPI0035288652